jgi:alpha-L-fucosidase 2
LYWFNKYLLLSSSSRSVSNLQGLWSDGPWNPWNSDYHLNINLQMVYWPAYSLGLQHAIISPLIQFIRQVSESGQVTARQLYGCSGWVGHGFTDDRLDMGIRGDLQWALCVTCGSWLALHLWDHLLYTEYSSPEYTSTMKTLLPVYRSMAQFYLDYLFEGPDGHVHTGPTTSPENSFAASTTNGRQGNRKMIQYLALSPAIDMSILRQVSSSSEVSLSLLSSPPHIRLRTLIHLHSNGPNIICPTPALTLRHRRSPLIEKI